MGLTEDDGWCSRCQAWGNVHDEDRHRGKAAKLKAPTTHLSPEHRAAIAAEQAIDRRRYPHPSQVTVTGDDMVTGMDITPKWRGLVLHMLELYRLGGDDDQSFLREQFLRMAHAADLYISIAGKPGVIATDMLTSEGLRP